MQQAGDTTPLKKRGTWTKPFGLPHDNLNNNNNTAKYQSPRSRHNEIAKLLGGILDRLDKCLDTLENIGSNINERLGDIIEEFEELMVDDDDTERDDVLTVHKS